MYYKMSWTEKALEDFFIHPPLDIYQTDKINIDNVYCGPSNIVKDQIGVFAKKNISKGECIEWGVATIIPGIDVRDNDIFYSWDTNNRSIAATVSGCGLFYNTLGDKSNCRCVPYHKELRFEIYALQDISKNEELTIRYDSMNYRQGMRHVRSIVGDLENGDRC